MNFLVDIGGCLELFEAEWTEVPATADTDRAVSFFPKIYCFHHSCWHLSSKPRKGLADG